jgi:uncharacterized protein (TIGR00304 family)
MIDLVLAGLLLVFAGVATLIVGMLLSQNSSRGRVRGGAVVLVGPVPIAFGSDAKWTAVAIALAIVLVVVTLVLYLS